MKLPNLTIVFLAAAPMLTANFVKAQTGASEVPTAPTTTTGAPPFGRPNLSDVFGRLLSLTDAQRAQLQPYIDTVQPQLEAAHQQARHAEETLLTELCSSIRPLLTPEQQIKLDGFEAMRSAQPPPPATHALAY